ncbi:MAG: DUF4349 domain-containing protein [Pedobacter sp.]|jgi:hypothetical protein
MQETLPSKPKKSRKKLWITLGIVGFIAIFLLIGLFIIGLVVANRYGSSSSDYGYGSSSYGLSSLDSLSPSESELTTPLSKEKSESSIEESTPNTAAGSADSSEGELTEQKVIKTGNVSLQVEKAESSVTSLTNLAKSKGGFVLSSSLYTGSDETQSGTVTLKVPVTKYEETMNEIKKLGDVQGETSSGQDVTEQYADLQAQLKNYKAEEAQYLEILKKASTVEDILKVTEKLSIVRGYIEVAEGRLKYLESQTDMSTITVSLSEETRIDIPTKEWQPYETLKQAFRTWIIFLQGLVNVFIWLIIFLGPVIVLIWIIVKLIIRRVRKKKSES